MYHLQTIAFLQWDAPPGLAQPPPLMERPLVVDGDTRSRTKLSRPRYAPSELLHHLLWTTRDCTDGYTDGRVLLCRLWSAWPSQSPSNATLQCRRSAVVHYGTGGLQLPSVGSPISSALHRTAPPDGSLVNGRVSSPPDGSLGLSHSCRRATKRARSRCWKTPREMI